MAIIPGVLVICTIVMMLTNGPSADGTYTGAAYEGVALLPWLGEKVDFILTPLFALPHVPAIFSQLLFVFFSLSDIFLLRSIRLRKNLIC